MESRWRSLHQAVAEHGPLPPATVRRLIAGVAEALIGIHAAGLVHRDLKPSNVLLAEDRPKVIDFGIARAVDATCLTRTGMRVGTPVFMTPEQVKGLPVTSATDVFALGQLAVFALTGRPAFGEGPADVLFHRIANEEPDLRGCPPALAGPLARCLSKDPADRPAPAEVAALAGGAGDAAAGPWLPAAVASTLHTYAPPRGSPTRPARPRKARTALALWTGAAAVPSPTLPEYEKEYEKEYENVRFTLPGGPPCTDFSHFQNGVDLTPTGPAACVDAVNLNPLGSSLTFARMRTGMGLCVVTEDHQVVHLRLLRKSAATHALTWTATAWAQG
ncbi:serine/threonine-protein kinase [Nonomuraea sp. NPDC049655]|uniref:serine/threonine-protein kinase n=1 Tax=Nonomuraea sp. NPDC049655 TaxID=3364355 RepID=UPI003798D7F4